MTTPTNSNNVYKNFVVHDIIRPDYSIVNRLRQKALVSNLKIKVAAGGITSSGLFIWATNQKEPIVGSFQYKGLNFHRYSVHAEIVLMLKLTKKSLYLDTMYIVAPKRKYPYFRRSYPCVNCLLTLYGFNRVENIIWFDGEKWVRTKLSEVFNDEE